MKARVPSSRHDLVPAAGCDRSLMASPECQRGHRRQNYRNRETGRRGSAHEGHRHVEGPVLREGACERSGAARELVVVGKDGDCENVVLYISQGLTAGEASQKPSNVPVFDQKGCMYTPHVVAMDVGQEYKVMTSDQTAHNIHPEPESDDRQHPVEPVAAAGSATDRPVGRRRKWRSR